MKLKSVEQNCEYYITEISVPKSDFMRLSKLGVVINAKFTVILKLGGGGVLIEVDGTDVAVGRETAKKIEVEKCKK